MKKRFMFPVFAGPEEDKLWMDMLVVAEDETSAMVRLQTFLNTILQTHEMRIGTPQVV